MPQNGIDDVPTFRRVYRAELYLEHLEEASFLYEQRLSLLSDPELTWLDLGDFEERFEAHIDALVVGGDVALAVCRQQAAEGDVGELHSAVRVFCRQERFDLLDQVLRALDEQDAERITAVSDALCHELPQRWAPDLAGRLSDEGAAFTRALVRALGYRRTSVAAGLIEALPLVDGAAVADALWSLGRLRATEARTRIFDAYLEDEDEDIRSSAAVALLRLGDPRAVGRCVELAPQMSRAYLPIGFGGGRGHLQLLMEAAATDDVAPECLLALGLLGDTAAVETLIYHIGNDGAAEAASTALYLMTGAELFEEVLIPEPVDEDELFEDELRALEEAGQESVEAAEPHRTTITRISQDPLAWRTWWRANRSLFKSDVRYRNGQPYSPQELLTNLTSDRSPRAVRVFAAEELAMRYACPIGFESDMFVRDQMRSIAGIQSWLEGQENRLEPGRYYWSGEKQGAR